MRGSSKSFRTINKVTVVDGEVSAAADASFFCLLIISAGSFRFIRLLIESKPWGWVPVQGQWALNSNDCRIHHKRKKTSSWRHIPSAIAAFSTQFLFSLKPICLKKNRQNKFFFNEIETEIPGHAICWRWRSVIVSASFQSLHLCYITLTLSKSHSAACPRVSILLPGRPIYFKSVPTCLFRLLACRAPCF